MRGGQRIASGEFAAGEAACLTDSSFGRGRTTRDCPSRSARSSIVASIASASSPVGSPRQPSETSRNRRDGRRRSGRPVKPADDAEGDETAVRGRSRTPLPSSAARRHRNPHHHRHRRWAAEAAPPTTVIGGPEPPTHADSHRQANAVAVVHKGRTDCGRAPVATRTTAHDVGGVEMSVHTRKRRRGNRFGRRQIESRDTV